MQWLWELMTLKFLITPYIIVLVYWIGALLVPALAGWLGWYLMRTLQQSQTIHSGLESVNRQLDNWLDRRWRRIGFWGVSIFAFLLGELLWRMLFEFLIIYYHIHDALMALTQ